MDRLVNVRLFAVDTQEDGGVTFSSALQQIEKKALEDREDELEPDLVIRLERLKVQNGVLSGEIVRRQTTNLPSKALRGRPIESLGVASIGHTTAFVFDSNLSVLAVQLARNGITATRIALYAEHMGGGNGFDILPIPNEKIWETLKRSGVRGVTFRIASPNELKTIDDETKSVKRGMAALKETLQPSRIEITMTMARGDADMDRKKTVGLFGWLQRERAEERGGVSKLIARVTPNDGEDAETLNLIHGHMGDKEWLNLPDDDPEASYRMRDAYIHKVLNRNRKTLQEIYD